jgi:hypothetical protein
MADEIRWDEKAGLRTGCGVRSQVIDVLEAQIKRRPEMKKVSTATAKQSRNISQQKLTIGLDLGDRNTWYCVLDEAGQIQLEQRVRTSAKTLQEVFGEMHEPCNAKLKNAGENFASGSFVSRIALCAMLTSFAATHHRLWSSRVSRTFGSPVPPHGSGSVACT